MSETKKRVTLRDVAAKANVSLTTASLVMNDGYGISTPVRNRVINIAKKMQYFPCRPGRPQTSTRQEPLHAPTGKIVIIADDPALSDSLEGSHYQETKISAGEIFFQHKYDIVHQGINAFSLPIESRGVLYFGHNETKIIQLADKRPIVRLMGSINDRIRCDHITYDNREVGIMAAHYAAKMKMRKVALLGLISEVFTERCRAFKETCRYWGIEFVEGEPIVNADLYSQEAICRQLDKLLKKSVPDMIFSPSDDGLPLIYSELRQRGLEPMKDLDIVSCNNSKNILFSLTPKPNVIDIRVREIGYLGAIQLLSRINNRRTPLLRLKIQPEFIRSCQLAKWWKLYK